MASGTGLERSRYDASDLVAKIVYYAILLVTLQIAFSVFGPNPISALLTGVVAWLPLAIVAIVIIVVAGAVAKAVRDILLGMLGGLSYGRWLATVASVFIWALGIIAALNQIGIATTVTTPVLITVLATIGAIAAIGIGGGLVRPMQQRWERWLGRMEQEAPQARAHAEAYQRGRADARAMTADERPPPGRPPRPAAARPLRHASRLTGRNRRTPAPRPRPAHRAGPAGASARPRRPRRVDRAGARQAGRRGASRRRSSRVSQQTAVRRSDGASGSPVKDQPSRRNSSTKPSR